MRTIEDFRRYVQETFDAIDGWCRYGTPDFYTGLEAAELAEEARRHACRFGYDMKMTPARTPQEALRLVGRLLAWATPVPNSLTVKQAADRLGVSSRTVYDLVECGRLKCQRIGKGRGTIRIRPADLDAYSSESSEPRLRYLTRRPA